MTERPRFTERQEQVIVRVLRGETDAEIAADLEISEQRVEQVIRAIAAKLPGPLKPRRRILAHLGAEPSRRSA